MVRAYIRRLLFLMAGLMVSAVGITMMLQANIGSEPWSVLQQGLSVTTGMTYGTAAALVGAAVVAIAVLCGESFGLGTLGNIVICPYMIDLLLFLDWIPQMQSTWSGILMLLGGMELLSLGTILYMKSAFGAGPRDALMVVLARKSGRTEGLCRSLVEILVVVIGWLLGGKVGIGTVISAVGIGVMFNLNFALLRFKPVDQVQENLPDTIRLVRGMLQKKS